MMGMGRWNSKGCQTRVKWFKVQRQEEELIKKAPRCSITADAKLQSINEIPHLFSLLKLASRFRRRESRLTQHSDFPQGQHVGQ
ncbi:hypothetical protein AVEN_177014-1 [Araneus ventricosus]|uniref:Uncharacterized protein n=1 Tax=Araneus ventricosus TaxID=182803 RepID=A0A4Y2I2K9_ARAVE|nr:hypothetical protein AVEN_177014-1 [Araneus ventricosus]